ncbi:MAG: DUF1080 domain-containing protein [Fibrobacterota bacterium]|nr:DUF1080 domain-containing protein [Fibrobacterota bacterium]
MNKWILTSVALLSLQLGNGFAQENVLSATDVNEGYTLLFDGTLSSFNANWVNYVQITPSNPLGNETYLDSKYYVDATCKCLTMPITDNASRRYDASDVRSKKMYSDFELRMTYRNSGNQGIIYRASLTGEHAWRTGVEYSIDDATDKGTSNPGAAYGLFAPIKPVPYNLFSTNKWNTARIVVKSDSVKGDSVEHWMNEKKVVGYRYHSPTFWDAYNANSTWSSGNILTLKTPLDRNGGSIEEGFISIQGDHGGKWMIKDLKITTKPCFGPLKADGSSACSGVASNLGSGLPGLKVAYTAKRLDANTLDIEFSKDVVRGATIVGMDGKVKGRAIVSQGGNHAQFSGSFQPGLYFLRLNLSSGLTTQKINLL